MDKKNFRYKSREKLDYSFTLKLTNIELLEVEVEMSLQWTNSKLNVFIFSLLVSLITALIDIIPRFGELQSMLISTILISFSGFIGVVNSKAGLPGVLIAWLGLPLERLIILLMPTGSIQSGYNLIKLLEFSIVSLLLCLSGLLCSIVARKFSNYE